MKKSTPTEPGKIKPRKGWSRYSRPYAPCKPRPPVKNFVDEQRTELGRISSFPTSLEAIHVPEGVDWSNINVDLLAEVSDYLDTYELVFYTYKTIETPNPHYESQMKQHEKDLVRWEEEKAHHDAELKEWKAWVKQEEASDLEKQLKIAEDLLKKHGRAVG